MGKNTIILAAGLAGVGKTTHLKRFAEMMGDSCVYLEKDEVNLRVFGQAFDPDSEYYRTVVAPQTYQLLVDEAKRYALAGKTVILDGYFGNKLVSHPVIELLSDSVFDVRVIYFHCSAEKQRLRLTERASVRDCDKEGERFLPYRRAHMTAHVINLIQATHLFIDTEEDLALERNIEEINRHIGSPITSSLCLGKVDCDLTEEEACYPAEGFKRVLARHVPIPSVKKVVILDAGGVLHPDSEFGLPNQNRLVELTGLSSEALAVYQDDHVALNRGELSLRAVFERVALNARKEPKPTADELIETYKAGITLYPGAVQMIRDLYEAGYQVVVLTNNSDIGVIHTKELLSAEGFVDMPVYGSAELHLQKPDPSIFSRVCEIEGVHPSACWFVDDRETNRAIARKLGMSTVEVVRPEISATAAIAVNACRDKLIRLGVLRHHDMVFPEGLDRGKYPSEFGIIDNRVVRYEPSRSEYVVTDEPNEDGNQRKRCLYESRLAQLIVERGRGYWEFAYHKINRLFLADFDIKAEASRLDKYVAYFDKIKVILIKEGFIDGAGSYSITDLRAALVSLFEGSFNLTNVSQFYYGIWLLDYGSEPLEPFVFSTDTSSTPEESRASAIEAVETIEPILMLRLFPDLARNRESRSQAYLLAQPWLTCGPPQLRGRILREDAPKPPFSNTIGIMKDTDVAVSTKPHFAAKVLFKPASTHPITRAFHSTAAPIIGGSSGTLGRNVFMLAPLVASGLLTTQELMQYVMGFTADLVYRGHHSFEEVATVANQVLFPLKPWFDPLRDPIPYYEQLLTPEFLRSPEYRAFVREHTEGAIHSVCHSSFFKAAVGDDASEHHPAANTADYTFAVVPQIDCCSL